jgi:hypothetical protein
LTNPADVSSTEVTASEFFTGATIRLFQVEVLVVIVPAYVLGDRALAPMIVAAFHKRFVRTIVLVAQDRRGVPTYFGPAAIATVLSKIPFDALAWRQYRFNKPKPMMLPIPSYPLPEDCSSYVIDEAGSEHYSEHDWVPPGGEQQRRTRTLVPDHELPETRR